MKPKIDDSDAECLERAVELLKCQFDSVQIFVVRHDLDEKTTALHASRGNWYSLYGWIKMWIKQSEFDNLTGDDEDEDEEA